MAARCPWSCPSCFLSVLSSASHFSIVDTTSSLPSCKPWQLVQQYACICLLDKQTVSSDHACLRANLCKQRHAIASHADDSLQALHRDSALTVFQHGMRPLHTVNTRLPELLAKPCTRALQTAAFPSTALMHVTLSYHHNSALSCSSAQHANKTHTCRMLMQSAISSAMYQGL